MARRTFFSFHYKTDVQRAFIVKNAWVTRDRQDAGFFDSSAFEEAERTDSAALKRFLIGEMKGSSVVCALVGAETALRRWVRFEIQRAIWDERGLMAVRVHSINNFDVKPSVAGPNPFDLLGVYVEKQGEGRSVRLIERWGISEQWSYSSDFVDVLPKWVYGRIPGPGSHALSEVFPVYDWASGGYANIGAWIDDAATQAGR